MRPPHMSRGGALRSAAKRRRCKHGKHHAAHARQTRACRARPAGANRTGETLADHGQGPPRHRPVGKREFPPNWADRRKRRGWGLSSWKTATGRRGAKKWVRPHSLVNRPRGCLPKPPDPDFFGRLKISGSSVSAFLQGVHRWDLPGPKRGLPAGGYRG
jgi:hypothetical protein